MVAVLLACEESASSDEEDKAVVVVVKKVRRGLVRVGSRLEGDALALSSVFFVAVDALDAVVVFRV